MKLLQICLIVAALFVCGVYSELQAQVAVIVNKSVPAGSMSASQISDLYALNTKQWGNGSKVVVFDLKTDGDVKSKFYGFLGNSSGDLKKIWMRLKLTGEGEPPTALSSDDEILAKVASTPGAIGFVNVSSLTAEAKSKVKVVLLVK